MRKEGVNLIEISYETKVPLIGTVAFGIIDRGTNVLQIRPTSLCPLSCIFCSTDAGPKSQRRLSEYIVKLDYIIEVFNEVVKYKGPYKLEAHIDTVGDPISYPRIVDLVQELSSIKGVEVVSMQTHGALLNERLIDELEAAGLSRINLSIDAMDSNLAKKLSGTEYYNIEKIKAIAEYIANSEIDLLIAPVWVPGINDQEIPKIIEFALSLGAGKRWPPLGIQKYEAHRHGRKPHGVRPMSWRRFYATLKIWEEKYNVKLILRPEDFGIHKRRRIPVPFKLGEKVYVDIVLPGWLRGEKIGVARNRVITVVDADNIPLGVSIKVRILRVKDNILIARPEI